MSYLYSSNGYEIANNATCHCVCGHKASSLDSHIKHFDRCPVFGDGSIRFKHNKLGGLVAPLPPRREEGESK